MQLLFEKYQNFYYRFYGNSLPSMYMKSIYYLYLVFVYNLLTMLAKYWMQSIHDTYYNSLLLYWQMTFSTYYLLHTEMRWSQISMYLEWDCERKILLGVPTHSIFSSYLVQKTFRIFVICTLIYLLLFWWSDLCSEFYIHSSTHYQNVWWGPK